MNEKRKESQRAVRKVAQQPQSDGLHQCGGRRKDSRKGAGGLLKNQTGGGNVATKPPNQTKAVEKGPKEDMES